MENKKFFKYFDIVAFALFTTFCFGFKCYILKQLVYGYSLIMGLVVAYRESKSLSSKHIGCKKYFMLLPLLFIIETFIAIAIKQALPTVYESYTSSYHVSVSLISNIIESVILGPIKEEYFFRYMPQKYCKNNYLYYFFAVIFFAYLHTPGLNLILILIRVPISALYAYAYKNTGKLSISIALHIAYNIIPCIFSLILLF